MTTPAARARPRAETGDERDRFNPSLTGLRGLAALAIVVAHNLGAQGFTLGVDIFFVLSGYLITRLIARELTAGTFSFRRFYIRRAWRLFPALLLMLAAVVVWTLLLAPASGRSMVAGTIAHSVVYIENWNIVATGAVGNPQFPEDPAAHTWSLSIEEQFYLLWPLLLVAAWRWGGVVSPSVSRRLERCWRRASVSLSPHTGPRSGGSTSRPTSARISC